MNNERLRMRPWLEGQINSGRIPGLVWLDKARGIYKVPWKHAGKPGFVQERDALLFREWARHTGKYRDGEQADPSTWKTRFRCALNKLPDIEEIKEQSNLDGDEPYRVFKFLPKGTKGERLEPEVAYSPPFTDVSPASSTTELNNDDSYAGAYRMQNTDESEESGNIVAQILHEYPELDDNRDTPFFSCSLDTPDYSAMDEYQFTPSFVEPPRPGVSSMSAEINDMIGMNPDSMSVLLKVFYNENRVLEKVVNNHFGCRVHSGVDLTRVSPSYNPSLAAIYGPPEVEQIQFPDEGSPVHAAIMGNLHRGLLLQWQNNNIEVTRYCQAHVYASGGCLGTNITQLVRGQPTKVFDSNLFLAGLAEYKLSKAPVPSYEVFFSFGQRPATGTTVDPGVLITVSVVHMTAKASISKMGSSSDVVMSIEDECDRMAEQLQQYVRLQTSIATAARQQQNVNP